MRLAIGCLVLLAGCAVLKPGYEDTQVVREIVETSVETLRATPEVQQKRLAAAIQALESRADDAARLRAALLLATLPAPFRDEARATALMHELSDRRPDTALTQFATLFQAKMPERMVPAKAEPDDRQRSTEKREQALREQSEALRSTERAIAEREEALKRRTQALRGSERSLAEREEAVRRQVEALREGERLMTEREETVRKQIEALRETERTMSEREGRLGTKTR
jgi:putative ABC transport system permease protein